MNLPVFLANVIQVAAVGCTAFLMVRVILYRAVPPSRAFMLLSIAAFLYAYGYLLQLSAATLSAAYLAQRVQHWGVALYAPLFYLFIREYGRRAIRPWWRVAVLFALPAVALVLVNFFPQSQLYFKSITFCAQRSLLVLRGGVLHHLHVAYNFALIALSTWEIWCRYPRRTPSEKVQRHMFLVSTLAPNLATILFTVDPTDEWFQLGSAALAFSLSILGYYIIHFRAAEWLPYARAQIVEDMADGFVLLDAENRFLDSNAAARRLFPALARLGQLDTLPALYTMDAGDAAALWLSPEDKEGAEALSSPAGLPHRVTVATASGPRTLRISATPVHHGGRHVGTSILMYDVTEMHHLMETLQQVATTDELTGMLNRRAFFQLAERDVALHRRNQLPACVVMLDIDHFKAVNDTYGHPAGDDILKQVAHIIETRMRRTDIRGRYGGEEFAILLPTTALAGGVKIAGHIRRAVEHEAFEYKGQPIQLTVSLGVAALDADRHHTLHQVLEDADAALYHAKHNGRNQVAVFHPENGSGASTPPG